MPAGEPGRVERHSTSGGFGEHVTAATRRSPVAAVAAFACALVLAGATFAHYQESLNGALWAAVQAVLVFICWFDVQERRIPNVVVAPMAAVAVALRLAVDPRAVPECLAAGAAAFGFFFVFALLTRGGLGMGDVKLAGLIGLLLGAAAPYALMLGVGAGGIAAVAILATHGSRKTSYPYGPYLAFGAAVLIVVGHAPRLA